MILTLTGASGAGKTTIARQIFENLKIYTQMVPSYTTRKPRETDIFGEYKYIGKLKFWFLKKIGSFLWTVYPHGNSYGTTKCWVTRALRDDSVIYIMILTPDAIKRLHNFAAKRGYPEKVFSFYILSPPQEVLRERLKLRGDSQEEIEKRISDCVRWDSEANHWGVHYGFIENNGSVESATGEVTNRFFKRLNDCEDLF